MHTNYKYRMGYMDADASIRLLNKAPGTLHLERLFKIKGKDYQLGFEKRLAQLSRKAEA